MIGVNGVEIPTPSDYQVGIMDLSQAGRNAKGNLLIERIATKRKIEMAWNYLDKDVLSQLLKLVSPVFFQVTYIDPQENSVKTGTFYVGDRNMGALDYKQGKIRYKDIKMNFIER